jgi:farnesyl-diphosphate farnesyltransferase
VLRGLDTIEDDMTIPDEKKQPLLRNFHKFTLTPGWTFTESGPNESDRQLLVEYDNVVEELRTLNPRYAFSCTLSQQLPNEHVAIKM